jgi:hypothetical protein
LSIYYQPRELGRELTPPSGEDAGSCSVADIESVKNVGQNVIRQCAEPIISTAFYLKLAWRQIRVIFTLLVTKDVVSNKTDFDSVSEMQFFQTVVQMQAIFSGK